MQHSPHKHYLFSVRDTEAFSFILFLSFLLSLLFLDFIFLMLSAFFPSWTSLIMKTEVLLCLPVILFHHYPKFSPIESGWSDPLLRKVAVLNPVTPTSVAQLDSIFRLYSLFSLGGIFTLTVFSSAERDLSRRWRLWEIYIYISTAKERFVSLVLPRIPTSLAWMFAHLFFHASPFLPSHISISLVKHADWRYFLGTDYK